MPLASNRTPPRHLTASSGKFNFRQIASVFLIAGVSLLAVGSQAWETSTADGIRRGSPDSTAVLEGAANTAKELRLSPAVATNLIAIFGTSLGKGQGSSGYARGVTANQVYVNGNSWSNGWAADLTARLQAGGWAITNDSQPGDNSTNGLKRFLTTVLPQSPKFVLISYSLGNDNLGYAHNPAGVAAGFLDNLKRMTQAARAQGIYPIIGLCYARDDIQRARRYDYLKAVNLEINTWNVPSLNFDGAINNGDGGLTDGTGYGDGVHPNDYGYREFYYAIPPTLFDALRLGKTNRPVLAAPNCFARLTRCADVTAPVTFAPESLFHSFTVSFRVRSTHDGTIAAIRTGNRHATLQIAGGRFVYFAPDGRRMAANGINATNGHWHDVAISSRYALAKTWLFVDGTLAGSVDGRYSPDEFILGGPGSSKAPMTPAVADFQDWCVYRSAWNLSEAQAQRDGHLQQASLEIGVMLEDAAFSTGTPVNNRAQSLALAMVNGPNLVAMHEAKSPGKSAKHNHY